MSKKKSTSQAAPEDNIKPALPNLFCDPVAFSKAMMDAYDKIQPVLERSLEKAASEDFLNRNLDPLNINPIYAQFMQTLAEDPDKFWALQSDYWTQWFDIWRNTTLRFLGDEAASTPIITPDKGDRRFRGEDWQNNALFDFIKQSYLLSCRWINETISQSEGLTDKQKEKLAFTAQLYANAMSPSNFALTNPEVLRETIESGGQNLVKGFENLVKDLERGDGELYISTTDYNAFEVGTNLAVTKGSVIYRNDLIELIQYAPSGDKVFQRPLLITPPWINKYYILDMKPENSFVKWLVDQGHTVFMISWVNPDKSMAGKGFEHYMEDGILAALNAIEAATGEDSINAIGYCLGGTLLSMTLAYLKANGMQDRIASATFLTTLLDFEHAGELKLFLDEEQIAQIDKQLEATGVFDAKILQHTFKLLRSNDLIWSFVVNNYLMGREPFPFDLLYWNDDSTNMPAAMQRFYLTQMYRDNKLAQSGGVTLKDVPIDLSSVDVPAYFLSTKEDHIAPWQATYKGPQLLGGQSCFTLAASGHIAGVVNPPLKEKYCYWTHDDTSKTAGEWLAGAQEHVGSWWPHWQKWIKPFAGKKIAARTINNPLLPAPGEYVRKRV